MVRDLFADLFARCLEHLHFGCFTILVNLLAYFEENNRGERGGGSKEGRAPPSTGALEAIFSGPCGEGLLAEGKSNAAGQPSKTSPASEAAEESKGQHQIRGLSLLVARPISKGGINERGDGNDSMVASRWRACRCEG